MTRKNKPSPTWSEELKAKPKDSTEQAQEADRQATRDLAFRYRLAAAKNGWRVHEYR